MKKVVVFDFDGTLTRKDSFIEFIKFVKGRYIFYLNLFFVIILWLCSKFKILETGKAKEAVFSFFFKGMTIEKFNEYGNRFTYKVNNILREQARSTIKYYLDQGAEVLIISASIENWIVPWAKENNIKKILATSVEINSNGKLTGRFSSANCKGKEKLERLLQLYPDIEPENLIVYGDSGGDKELIDFASTSFYKTLRY